MTEKFLEKYPEFKGKLIVYPSVFVKDAICYAGVIEEILEKNFVRLKEYNLHFEKLIEGQKNEINEYFIDKQEVRKAIDNNISSWKKRYKKYNLEEGSKEWVKTNLAIIVLQGLKKELKL